MHPNIHKKRAKVIDATSSEGFLVSQKKLFAAEVL